MERTTRREFAAGLVAGTGFEAGYVKLARSGELEKRAAALGEIYKSCRLCPRRCGVDRTKGELGVCRTAARLKVASAHPHHGEERPISGRRGSGTVFFSNCNLLCMYCQNWEINHRGDGSWASEDEVGRMFTGLQELGCHNINLVTPTHVAPGIVGALRRAVALGLRAPLVYNCGGYESVEVLRLLEGIVDIYLPDFKYQDGAAAGRLSSGAADYPEAAAAAIEEMQRQVGELKLDAEGVAQRGLLIRHLVLPENLAGTDRFVKWVAGTLGRGTWVNIMPQYRPEHRARERAEVSRRITGAEWRRALDWAREAGLTHVLT